ncbi:MAG: tRNA preQ1(34) S-adenosylmethionine ribosyltransferase-isomerase QueA [Oligoflexia bacterium]|nr:tRNA preQ1(34) S-adenosylmethionine ribosyltransferase-isomerase QueA [Oligoflexia bacterium]
MVDLNFLEAYAYDLPERLIAQQPVEPRDSCRLLVVDRAKRSFEHRIFTDLPDYLDSRDLAVANNTKVIPARLLGYRLREERGREVHGGRVEFVLLEEREPLVWEGLFHASAKYVPGVKFEVPTPDGGNLRGELVIGSKDMPQGTVVARFDRDPVESGAGQLPLPHYIHRPVKAGDDADYQTVYASNPGSAAAPTAGLHFTERVLSRLRQKGVEWEELTLNVGLGTFRPVKTEDVSQHSMHEERYSISSEAARRITEAKHAGRRILAIGTTSVRALESAWDGASLKSGPGKTSIFIRPGGSQVRLVDRLLTNFHLPRSTLLMLVCAFADHELIMAAYHEALREQYRFFSYGDAMLII